mmetsp:Transcript_46459/g.86646  ORF Transcript_46459/g.86646 Transcript_46459/m.86646 type:complete len:256 (+) Transcript_46459:364-1131(+)
MSSSSTSCPCALAMVRIMVPSSTCFASTSPRAALFAPTAFSMAFPSLRIPRALAARPRSSMPWSLSTFLHTARRVTSTSSREADTMVSKNTGRLVSMVCFISRAASADIPSSMPPRNPSPPAPSSFSSPFSSSSSSFAASSCSAPSFLPSFFTFFFVASLAAVDSRRAVLGLTGGGPSQPPSFHSMWHASWNANKAESFSTSLPTISDFSTHALVSNPTFASSALAGGRPAGLGAGNELCRSLHSCLSSLTLKVL